MTGKTTPQGASDAMPMQAVVLTLGTYALFTLLDASAKWLVGAGHALMFVVWCRFASQAGLTFLLWRGWRNGDMWRMHAPAWQVARGLMLPASTIMNFTALKELQLAQTSAILLSVPLIVTAISVPMLGEKVGWRRWASVITGFIGVLVVVRPGTDLFTPAILWSLGSAVAGALYNLMTRKLAPHESQSSLIFYPGLFAVALLAPLAWPVAQLPQKPAEIALLAGFGLFGLAGHAALIAASRLAGASRIAPFAYSQLLWMATLGFVLFGDLPDGWTIFGAAIICAAGVYTMHRERVIARQARVVLPEAAP